MKLRKWLEDNKWTQAQFGEAVGVSAGRVSQMLKAGRVTPELLPKAHMITGLPLHDLNPAFPDTRDAA